MIGAVYLDQGYERCYDFIHRVFIQRFINIDTIARKEMNFKSHLIEWSQKNKLEVTFNIIESFNDNDGNPVFQTAVILAGDIQMGIGIGYTKKESQQNASQMAIKKLRSDRDLQQAVADLKKKRKANVAVADIESDAVSESAVSD